MAGFLLRRALSGLLLLALLTFLTFFVFNAIPTNPACLVVACGPDTTTNDAQIRAADRQLGINRPVFVQYGKFVWRLVRHGDLGTAWTSQVKVRSAIGAALPATASVVGGGMILMMLLALPLGALAAIRPRSPTDRGLLAVSLIGLAIHPFVLGILLRDLLSQHAGMPYGGYCPLLGNAGTGGCGGLRDWALHLAVPWLVFALFFLPLYMRMLRVRLIDVLNEPWISTARAKGASETRILVRHALRNAIGPLLPMIAIDAGTAITAAIYIESVFQIHGVGLLAVQAFSGQAGGYDLPLTAGIVATIGAVIVLLNMAADVAASLSDPRLRSLSRRGLIPLPRALQSRPRARLALSASLAVLAIGGISVAAAQDNPRGAGVDLGRPIHTYHARWFDFERVQTGRLEATVTRLQIGSRGWQVHASITNATTAPVPIEQFADTAAQGDGVYPHQGMSLLVPQPNGYGGKKIVTLPAQVFRPSLPRVLAPQASWRGTFSANETVPAGSQIYVGFGQFLWDAHLISIASSESFDVR